MAFTQGHENDYNFSEVTESDNQVLVTNNLGRTILPFEIVYLGGYLGEVRQYGGIANGESGYINITTDRTIRTEQVEPTDTFTAGNTLYFLPGNSSLAGKLVDAAGGAQAIGTIIGEEGTGGAQTAVLFRPFLQKVNNGDLDTRMTAAEGDIEDLQAEPRTLVYKVVANASGSGLAIPGLSVGDEIIGVKSICTVSNTAGTLKVTDGTHDITNAMQQATVDEVANAATMDQTYTTLPAGGAKVVAGGTDATLTRGILVITYIPA